MKNEEVVKMVKDEVVEAILNYYEVVDRNLVIYPVQLNIVAKFVIFLPLCIP